VLGTYGVKIFPLDDYFVTKDITVE